MSGTTAIARAATNEQTRTTGKTTADLRIDAGRLMSRLSALAEIGSIEGGGSCRLALTDDDKNGRDCVVGWMREQGLQADVRSLFANPTLAGFAALHSHQENRSWHAHPSTLST